MFLKTSFFAAGRISRKNGEGFQKAGFQPNSHLLFGRRCHRPAHTACGIVTKPGKLQSNVAARHRPAHTACGIVTQDASTGHLGRSVTGLPIPLAVL